MIRAGVPPKFPLAFASGAGSAFTRQIPTASQISTNAGAASLTDGFPPATFNPVAAGGIPPAGPDFNGLFNQITKWDQWVSAGGPILFDASFSAAISGYPQGSLIQSNTGHAVYESLVDNNTADPNLGSNQWRISSCVWGTVSVQASGSANAQTITLTPAPTGLAQLTGIPLTITSQGTNTGGVTLNPNGLGAAPLQLPGGIALSAGILIGGAQFQVVFNGSSFILLSRSSVFTDVGNGGVVVDGTANSAGGNITLRGNGGTTPNKYIRAFNGAFQILGNSYTTILAALSDAGNLLTAGPIQATGNVTANAGRLRASLGALGSGDANSGTILSDFASVGTTNGFTQFPNGVILQWGAGTTVSGNDFFSFPRNFPSTCFHIFVIERGAGTWFSSPPAPTAFATPVTGLGASTFQLVTVLWNQGAGNWGLIGGVGFSYYAIGI